jgi:hypothetical protein
MSMLISSDPLAMMAIEAGMVSAPLAEGAAEGDSQLDTQQRAAAIGEPVPIVFCKRDEGAGTGGVLISPAATEARFSNDVNNAVTASYHLVLSEGRIGSIEVRDVFQRSCRVGSHSQTYDRRAGTWTPGNFITTQAGYTPPECPYYCGSVGTYTGMSTLSFENTIPDGSDLWNRQVHCFIRNGMRVPRLLQGSVGSSNNFADLVYWSLKNCAKLYESQIDYDSLVSTARFLAVNQFNCDINITESQNLGEMLAKMAPYFLLAETRVAGRRGLRPLLPVNSDGTIQTTPVQSVFTFTEDHVLLEQLTVSYIPTADRKPFAVRTIWRQQLDDDLGIIRSSEVRIAGEAEDGPYEQHDLSKFATREDHAVKVAAYIRARRKYVTHTVSASFRSIDFPADLVPGSIVQLLLKRINNIGAPDYFNYLYQVDRITKTAVGDVSMQLVHFPVDEAGCSLVAKAVVETVGTGILLTSNRTGVSCDIDEGRSTDTSVPAETGQSAGTIDPPISWIISGEQRPTEEPLINLWPPISLYIYSVTWEDLELVIKVRGTPTGLGAQPPELGGVGPLVATLKSGTVQAYDDKNKPVNVQSLPSLNVTATIIAEEDADSRPQSNEIFQGEIRVPYSESDFPDPDVAAYYRMPIEITNPIGGGFSSVEILNSGVAQFDAIAAEDQDANGFEGDYDWAFSRYTGSACDDYGVNVSKKLYEITPWLAWQDQTPRALKLSIMAPPGCPQYPQESSYTFSFAVEPGLYEMTIEATAFTGTILFVTTYSGSEDVYDYITLDGSGKAEWSRTMTSSSEGVIVYVYGASVGGQVIFRNFRHP